jgi:hypothetical protein
MKKAFFLALAVILSASLAACSKDAEIQKALSDSANTYNKTCPTMLDSETRLDSVIAVSNKTLQYTLTMVNIPKSQVSDSQLASIQASAKPGMVSALKANADLAQLKGYGVSFQYVYKSNDGYPLMTVTIAPADYQ